MENVYQQQAERLAQVVSRISYPGLRVVLEHSNHGICLQVQCPDGVCNVTGEPSAWKGRQWPVDLYSSNGEIVRTAFKAIMTALEHEARELFLFQGKAVMDPHEDYELVRTAEVQHGQAT